MPILTQLLLRRILPGIAVVALGIERLEAGSLDGAPIRWAGALWHDGAVEISFPANEGDKLDDLLVPGAIASEPGVDVLDARIAPPLMTRRSLIVRVAGLPLYEGDGRPWFVGMPRYDTGTGAKPGPVLGLYRAVSSLGWSLIGQNRPGRTNDVVVAPANSSFEVRSFEVVSDGRDSTGTHDDMVFVHEYVQGDFDRVVHVTSVLPTALFGGAGLMVREALDAGRPASDSNFSRFAAIEVAGGPAVPALVARTESPGNVGLVTFGSEIPYPNPNDPFGLRPNVWFRLVRQGETIHAYQRSERPRSPGDTWTTVGQVTFPGLANGLFVGAHYSPQLAHAVQPGTTDTPPAAARFESYGPLDRLFLAVDGSDPLSIRRVGDTRFLFWGGFVFGRLHVQESTDFNTWTDDSQRRSAPFYIRDGDGARFWRLAD